jgi:hypothetical protein
MSIHLHGWDIYLDRSETDCEAPRSYVTHTNVLDSRKHLQQRHIYLNAVRDSQYTSHFNDTTDITVESGLKDDSEWIYRFVNSENDQNR